MKKAISLVLVLVGLAAGPSAFSQVITGSISGTVKDSTNAVMPGASVQIKNVGTGGERALTTDARGHYNAANLSPGMYDVTATLAGFQTEVRRGIAVNVSQASVADFTLKVGAVSEKVEVSAEAPLVETTNAVVTGLVSEQQVEDLPLNNRSLIELAPLQAGIVPVPTAAPGASKGMGAKIAISGTRYNSNLFQIDGASINDLAGAAGSASNNLMGAETIQEFNVVINAYSAEYGNHSGGVFNAVTKSGTNTMHGSAFEFLRNDNLDSNSWDIRNVSKKARPEFKRNQFGGSLGGPLVPDRTFYFGSYEGLRERLGDVATFNVPTAELRRGDIYTLTANREFVFSRHRDVAPQVQPYLKFYPLPDADGVKNNLGTQSFSEAINKPTKEDYFALRGDHKISDQDSLFGRYTFSDAYKVDSVDLAATNYNRSREQSASVGQTHIFSPSVINQLLLSWARNNLTDADSVIHEDAKGRLPGTFQFTSFPGTIGAFTVQSATITGFGNEGARNYLNNTYQIKDDLFYTAGDHSLKFGFNTQRNFLYAKRHFNGQGSFAFQNNGDACGAGTCQGMDNFLRGMARNFVALTRTSQDTAYIRNQLYGLYVQDDWRLSPRLTLNLVLRYEFITVPNVEGGRVSTLADFTRPNQSMADLILGNPPFKNPSLKNFAPRIGVVWDVTGGGRTSIRAGAGIFHDQINPGSYNFSFLSSPPYYIVGNINGSTPSSTITNPSTPGYTGCGQPGCNAVGNPSFPDAYYTQQSILGGQPNLEGFQYIPEQPTVYKWSLEVQHQLPAGVGATLGYSGNRGVHLFRVVTSMNAAVSEMYDGRLSIASNALLISPTLGRIRPRFSDVTSNYNALLLSVRKRLSRGLQLQSSYTFSKTVDDASNFTGSSDFDNGPSGSRYFSLKDRGPAAFDIRQSFVTNASYQLPGAKLGGAAGAILGGWQLSSILTLRGGPPFNVETGTAPGNFRNLTDYPDLVGEIHYDPRNPDHYFDTAAFATPPRLKDPNSSSITHNAIGNAGRSILIAPGAATLDLVLEKRFRLTERAGLQFRSEFFNLFNRVNYGLPNGDLSSNPGKITTTTGVPRQVQFGMRIEF